MQEIYCTTDMASTETTGAAASMKAEKASRESLAKKKSSVKAELEKVAAELEEIEQLKAEAEDLEDEEMLNEMQAEERRLQVMQHLPSYRCLHSVHISLHVIQLAKAFELTKPKNPRILKVPPYGI